MPAAAWNALLPMRSNAIGKAPVEVAHGTV
jgi:hypothetical protein